MTGTLTRQDVFLTTKLGHPAAPPHVAISHLRTWNARDVVSVRQRVLDDMAGSLDDAGVGFFDLVSVLQDQPLGLAAMRGALYRCSCTGPAPSRRKMPTTRVVPVSLCGSVSNTFSRYRYTVCCVFANGLVSARLELLEQLEWQTLVCSFCPSSLACFQSLDSFHGLLLQACGT
jgi:hypothetical protein